MRISPQKILTAAQTNAFLVSNITNILYLTGLQISVGYVLITKGKVRLFVDARYSEAVMKNIDPSIHVCEPKALPGLMQRIKECGYEGDTLTCQRFRALKKSFHKTKLIYKEGIIEEFRRAKHDDELRNFKKAQRITKQMIAELPDWLAEGVSELDIAWKLQCRARELGAEGLSFDPIVAFGTHTSRPHHHPTRRTFRWGHLVQIDVGAKVHGYCADQSEVLFTGSPTKKQKEVFRALKETKETVIQHVKPGVTTHQLDTLARDVLRTYDLDQYFTHALGHGVGLDIHEGVSLSKRVPEQTLLKNEIITIEPGVYIPGKFGMRLEEEVIV